MGSDKEKFGERVRKVADLVGGQAELARRTGISKVTIGSYIAGESEPSRERLIAMANAAGVSLLWLAVGDGPIFIGENEKGAIPQKTISTRPGIQEMPQSQPCLVDANGHVSIPRWDNPDLEMFDYVPMAEAQLSAGGGCFVLSEKIEGYYAFRKNWLSRVASSAKNLVLMRVQGGSMAPTIQDGDTVMIDTGRLSIKEGMLYALRFDSTIMIKRLSFRPEGRVLIISDNRSENDPYEADIKNINIIGQVIFFSRTFVQD